MPSVINENHAFQDVAGLPIVDGYIHIGANTQDPTMLANKITIYSDRDLTIPLSNPQRTDAYGKSVNKIFIPGKYAIVATDIDGNQKYIDLDAGELPGTGVTRCENAQGTNDIIVDAVPTITALVDNQLYVFRAAATNTGAMTLQVDTTTQYPIKKQHDIAMSSGDIEANQTVVVAFNETDLSFELISSPLVLAAVDFSVTGILKTSYGTAVDDTDIDGSNILTLPLDGNTYDFSGTQQLDEIATTGLVGTEITLVHTSARILTHHATNLILPNSQNITTVAGDVSRWVEYAAGDWRMASYTLLSKTRILVSDPSAPIVGETWINTTTDKAKIQLASGDFTVGSLDIQRGIISRGQWSGLASADETTTWKCVCWSPELSLFAAVGGAGTNRVATSPNGVDWTAQTASEANTWTEVVWSPEEALFVAVSLDGTNRVMTSPDGVTWTARAAAAASAWLGLCWSPDLSLFVAVANSDIMTSPDGVTWTSRTSPEANGWASVCWSPENSLFVSVSTSGTNRAMTSANGIDWTVRAIEASQWEEVLWAKGLGLFVATAVSGTNIVSTSPDGIVWTSRTAAEATSWSGLAWAEEVGLLFAVATSGTNRIMVSSDAVNWFSRSASAANAWTEVCWAPEHGVFVAVAQTGTNRVMHSL